MAHAPPYVPHGGSSLPCAQGALRCLLLPAAPASVVLDCPFLSQAPPPPQPPAPLPPLPPAPLQQILGFHHIPDPLRQSCFLYWPLPMVPKAAPRPPPCLLRAPPVCSSGGAGGSTAKAEKLAGEGDGYGRASAGEREPCYGKPRKGTWFWMTKEEAERRRQNLESLNLSRSSATSSSPFSSPPSSTASPSSSSAASSPHLEFDESHPQRGTRTTVMIKNIPNKYRRELLVKLLDDHCVEENKKLSSSSDTPPVDAPPSEYDFVYLPIDFRSNCCLGYAFVNFTTPEAAWRFRRAMDKHRWGLFGTKKISHICYARIQGKDAMVANFWGSYFMCDSDEFLPATFSPPRDGAPPCPPPTVVGRRWPRFPSSAAAEEGTEETEPEAIAEAEGGSAAGVPA
ncbi:unnamed protein product [Spirodela intermedia]|uniref:Mei2-like C-terminal RNA recognition motif domain-containing protein n=1 Tax=Spirodela intermedia TaxID=51605 RepID=A0A7I8KVA5_SPIIN|nr:unnamed protein product [Spirodela intermedia]